MNTGVRFWLQLTDVKQISTSAIATHTATIQQSRLDANAKKVSTETEKYVSVINIPFTLLLLNF